MRNEIAEWVLSLAAPPEQAATIVGDLLEAQHGPVEFWFAVLRATVSIARHQPRYFLGSFPFIYELVFYISMWWFFSHRPSWYLAFVLIGFGGLWLLLGRKLKYDKRRQSVIPAVFCFWLLTHEHLWSTKMAILLGLALVLGLWLGWRSRRASGKPGAI